MVPTPECDKMLVVKDMSQAIGSFLEWLDSQGLVIARLATNEDVIAAKEEGEHLQEGDRLSHFESIENILARYFKIDLAKVDAEQRALLEELRNAPSPKAPEEKCAICGSDLKWPDGQVHAQVCRVCFLKMAAGAK